MSEKKDITAPLLHRSTATPPFIIGNWKMNGSLAHAHQFAADLKEHLNESTSTLILCPSFPYLLPLIEEFKGTSVQIGAQNCSAESKGAFTGDVSAAQLADIGCTYVLIGHSERRQHHQETSELIRQKWKAAREKGLHPVLCMGESLAHRKSGHALSAIAEQLSAEVAGEDLQGLLIAYEPLWAIGTGLTPTLDEIEEVLAFIRAELKDDTVPLLYGGSVTPSNAPDILALPSVNGLLIGGASLQAEDFLRCSVRRRDEVAMA